MVGVRKKFVLLVPALTQHHRLSSLRCAQRRTVDGSGKRVWIFAVRRCLFQRVTGGDALASLLPAAQLKGPDGASQSGKIVKVLLHGVTDSAPHPDAFVLLHRELDEPSAMADDRVVAANGTSPRQQSPAGSPRLDVVFSPLAVR